MNMIERVARAISHCATEELKRECGGRVDMNWEDFIPEARAAIEAMREPTKEMIEPGYEAINASIDFYNYDSGSGYTIADIGPTKTWQAMIDAALIEE